jgi:transcriptional regulator with XRE-family HTH domain
VNAAVSPRQAQVAIVAAMGAKERPADRGARRAVETLAVVGRELRDARVARGVSQAQVGRAAGLSASRVSLIERGRQPRVPFVHLCRLLAVVGLDLSAKVYPFGDPIRDRGHTALLERLHRRLAAELPWMTEVPLPNPGDPRAWDALIRVAGLRVAVEAETGPRDVQALERRLALKERDGGVDRLILLLADTRGNRAFLRAHGDVLRVRFPVPGRTAMAALEAGQDPGGNAIILL